MKLVNNDKAVPKVNITVHDTHPTEETSKNALEVKLICKSLVLLVILLSK